jgi:hypothetical protein
LSEYAQVSLTRSNSSLLRDEIITTAPEALKAFATASPMPLLAPVTQTTLF